MDLTRRAALSLGTATTISLLAEARFGAAPSYAARLRGYPFTLGVASGDPAPDSVVLWTRLAPEPLTADGGMPDRNVEVTWQVATDEAFKRVVRTGTSIARPASAHSVHAGPGRLQPDRVYFYRFLAGGHASPVGRTRTFPAVGAAVTSMTLATVSCQSLHQGRYAAYRHLASRDHDVVLHLGDYIYENAGPASPIAGAGRRHRPWREATTLTDYRIRHAQYRLDRHLQAAHASAPFLCIPDDHDVVNNMAGPRGRRGDELPADFRPRMAAAYQAYYEHLPLRRRSSPQGSAMQLFRRLRYGDLAELTLLDTRQFRSPQVDGANAQAPSPEMDDEARTMTGSVQEGWFLDGLAASAARWNVVGQQVPMAAIDLDGGTGTAFDTDKWSGYPAARERITGFLDQARPRNPVFLAGDVHAAMVNDITVGRGPDGPVVASELLGSSVSSTTSSIEMFETARSENPQMLHYDGLSRGYLSCTITPDALTGSFWSVDDALLGQSPVRLATTWTVLDGVLGAQS